MVRTVRIRKAFTLIELLVVIAIIALLIGILLPALGEARRSGKLTQCQSNLHNIAIATQSYSTQFQDKLWSFTVTARTADRLTFPDLVTWAAGGIDTSAAAAQAVDIVRRRTGNTTIPVPPNWIPHVLYNHLVLQDFLASRLPEKMVACAADPNRLRWQTAPDLFGTPNVFSLDPVPLGSDIADSGWRWPYSSSYETVPYHYSAERGPSTVKLRQATHRSYTVPGVQNVLGKRRMADVMFPSQKVGVMDSTARHFGKRTWWYSHAPARIPVMFYDSSVRTKLTGAPQSSAQPPSDSNEGWDPFSPASPFYQTYSYEPDPWEAPTLAGGYVSQGAAADSVVGFHRWTRGGLSGADFDGKEIRTTVGW